MDEEPLHRHLALISGSAHPTLAEAVASKLGIPLAPTTRRRFASGESFVSIDASVRGADVFVLQAHAPPVNDHLVELLLFLDALHRASARSVTVVVPFFPYSRQDKRHLPREPISASLIANLIATAGADRVLTIDIHTDQLAGFFPGPLEHLHALAPLAVEVRHRLAAEDLVVVSPDAGRVKSAERWGDHLQAPLAIVHKRRDPSVPNKVQVFEVVGEVAGRTAVLVDDMIDTAGTLTQAAAALVDRGAARVVAVATHGVLSDPALERLEASPIEEVFLTDTLPAAVEAAERSSRIHVVSIAPLLADAIRAVFHDASVSSLSEGLPHH